MSASGAGTAASGGKGGSYGGPQMQTMPALGGGTAGPINGPSTMPVTSGGTPGMTGGGKGGSQAGGGKGGIQKPQTFPGLQADPYRPDESGGVSTMPVTDAPAAPNGFEQGLNSMNQGMDWFGNQLGYQAPQLGGDYNVGGIDGKSYLSQMGSAGGGGYTASMMTAPGRELYDYDPAQAQAQSYQAAQLSDKNINDYMNPYTQNVIDTTMSDLNKARQQALNSTGAAATAGGAFGGDRHAIMEAQNNADYMDQVARSSAQLRNQGYQNAQSAAMGDVNAMNQSYQSNAGMAQQSNLANQAANNARSQFVGSTANQNAMQTGLSNQSASNQAKSLGAQLSAQASIANANNKNSLLGQMMGLDQANQQFNAGMQFNKDQFNAGQDQQSWQNQFNAANNLYGMGNDRWNMTNNMNQQLAGVGNQIDGINNGILNDQFQQFMNQSNAPWQNYQSMLGALSGVAGGGGQTQSYSPGKMDFLGMGTQLGAAALMGSDMRLKENIQKVATVNGINLYSWDWNEDGLSNFPGQKPFGVMAQEIAETRPEAVVENEDGWLMVDYGKLPEVCPAVMGAQYV
jgi:hypothetical protein